MENEIRDRELLRSYLRTGNRRRLGAFLRRHEERLLRFAARFLGDAEAAQDVVQETFLEVARAPEKLLSIENYRNWLLTVTRNKAVTYLRGETRMRKSTEGLKEKLRSNPPASSLPDSLAERKELIERVWREVGTLRPRYRELILLRLQQELSYREIAQVTGLTVTNVGYLLHRALRELSDLLNHIQEVLE